MPQRHGPDLLNIIRQKTVVDPRFPERGEDMILSYFPQKNCMKLRTFWSQGGGPWIRHRKMIINGTIVETVFNIIEKFLFEFYTNH